MWIYNEEEFNPEENDIEKYQGFVYMIEEQSTGMKYIGKKFFWKPKTLPVTKSRKRKKKTIVESDWRNYYGSNKTLSERVSEASEGEYQRTILRLCITKGDCAYYEMREQLVNNVLLKPDEYYNAFVGGKIHRKHLTID